MSQDTSAAEAALKAKLSRKRTKTGCLTCRKRRIKCGEERPVCKNCIKSKRQCEGYNQRVIFRPPAFDYRPAPHGGAHITFQTGPFPDATNAYPGQQAFDPAFYPPSDHTAPDPHAHHLLSQDGSVVLHPYGPPPGAPQYPHPPGAIHPATFAALDPSAAANQPPGPPVRLLPPATPTVKTDAGHDPFGIGAGDTSREFANGFPDRAAVTGPSSHWQQYQSPKVEYNAQNVAFLHDAAEASSASRRSSVTVQSHQAGPERQSPIWRSNGYIPRPELQRPIDYRPPQVTPSVQRRSSLAQSPSVQPPASVSPTFVGHGQPRVTAHFLNAAAVEAQDDDYYDVQSDDEMDIDTSGVAMSDAARQRRLTQLLERHSISVQDLQMRRYDTFIYDGILDHYRLDDHANPLQNRATALVFAHFIAVTGPSLSIFERHLRSSSVLFSEGQIPFPQQGLWTYTMPLAALRHRGLLHAMLAMASLHIARLQNASPTPSMQHYTWAVKRVRHCVGHPKKRLKVSTIAASLLLGIYEVMTADHMKWNMHLAGSKQLFLELDFGSMVRHFRRMKRDETAAPLYGNGSVFPPPFADSNDGLLDQMYDVDERLVSQIVGKEVKYEEYGHVMTPQSSIPPELDLGKFAILKDLWWWYCKQDVYQSIVSGNPLLLDYSRWSNCPPRAPLGQPDAVYGSVDHLILLLGRIADFAARDRARKLKQMEANGGQWRPPPGTKMPATPAPPTPVSATTGGPSHAPEFGPPLPHSHKPPEPPLFFGMAPPPRTDVTMPHSYMPANGAASQATPPQEIVDLEAATHAAKEEHGRIRAALFTFQNSLGEGFQPLSSEYQQEMETPFGKALFFRSYDIGCLWAIFHMATIVTIRSHPDMHPAAHAAAAIAAHETAFQANEIGRIAAGIVPGPPDLPLNPTLGATLCESCMPSFFAAIQYHTAAQRHATVVRMYNIAQRTGWGSIELIANGCETSWVKAAAAGRGPPYARVVRPRQSADPRLNGSWERLDPDAAPDEKDEGDRRLVRKVPTARLNWAIGIMGTEEDVVMG